MEMWKIYQHVLIALEKLWVFPQRIWIFKEEFRTVVSTTVTDNLEF